MRVKGLDFHEEIEIFVSDYYKETSLNPKEIVLTIEEWNRFQKWKDNLGLYEDVIYLNSFGRLNISKEEE